MIDSDKSISSKDSKNLDDSKLIYYNLLLLKMNLNL